LYLTNTRIREWLKTLRKKNVAVVFATQSLTDIERSSIAPALIESCPTRIFLPNDRALEPQARAVYERFGLNARQIEILSIASPKRDYYAQSARGNRLFELGLGPVALALTTASSPEDQVLIDRCLREAESGEFAARFLEAKGFPWASELMQHWRHGPTPRGARAPSSGKNDATVGSSSGSRGFDPHVGPAPVVAAPADHRSEEASVVDTIIAAAPPDVESPMPERLSPYRITTRKFRRRVS